MEGFLLKKGRGESFFGRHNWKERWFVLDEGILYYYDTFNSKTDTPGVLKGTVVIAQAVVQEIKHKEMSSVFQITPVEGKPILLHGETDEITRTWVDAVNLSIEQHKVSQITEEEACKMFGFAQIGDATIETLDNAYQEIIGNRSTSRSHSHDSNISSKKSSGSPVSVNLEHTTRAYKKLIVAVKQRIRKFNFFDVTFECCLQRVGPGIDFGISVDDVDGEIVVTDVMNKHIQVISIGEESNGVVVKGDAIIGVEKDITSSWSVKRLNQRLSLARVPNGATINLTFQRQLPKTKLKQNFEDLEQLEEFFRPENTVGKFSARRASSQRKKGGSIKSEGDLGITAKIVGIELNENGKLNEAFI